MDIDQRQKPCPECGTQAGVPTGMTGMSFLWGGVIGHKVMKLVRCPQCGTQYSAKYGWHMWQAALIYTVIVFMFFGLLSVLLFSVLLG